MLVEEKGGAIARADFLRRDEIHAQVERLPLQ